MTDMNDETGRILTKFAVALERHVQIMLAGGKALKESGATIAADSALTVGGAWQSVADALYDLAAAPADQRGLVADSLAMPGPSDVGEQALGRPFLEVI